MKNGFAGENINVEESKRKNGFNNMSNTYTQGMNQFKSEEKLPFEFINFISIIIGICGFVSYFFIPFYYGLIINVVGVLLSVICRTRRISGIVVNCFSFLLILIIMFSTFAYNSISKFVKHHIIKKDLEYSIVINTNLF